MHPSQLVPTPIASLHRVWPQVLCAMVADDPSKQRWLHAVGALPLLDRLFLQRQRSLAPSSASPAGKSATLATSAPSAAVPSASGPRHQPSAGAAYTSGAAAHSPARTAVSVAGALRLATGPSQPAPNAAGAAAAAAAAGTASSSAADSVSAATGIVAGVLSFFMQARADVGSASSKSASAASPSAALDPTALPPPPLCLQRQAARLLALLAMHPTMRAEVAAAGWADWLRTASASDDCKLSSTATKARHLLELLFVYLRLCKQNVSCGHDEISFVYRHSFSLCYAVTRLHPTSNGRFQALLHLEAPSPSPLAEGAAAIATPHAAPVYADCIHLFNPGQVSRTPLGATASALTIALVTVEQPSGNRLSVGCRCADACSVSLAFAKLDNCRQQCAFGGLHQQNVGRTGVA